MSDTAVRRIVSWLAASRSFAPSMLWRVASRSFCGTGAANTPPAAARAASSSTTSDSSGKRRSKRVSVSGLPSAMPPTTPSERDQVIVPQLLHRTVAVNAHREARCDDRPGLPGRRGLRRLCRGDRRLRSGRRLPARRRGAGDQGKRGQQGPQELVHWRILQDLMPARNSSVRYGSVAQFLHWGIVVLLIVQVTLGKIADSLPVGLERLVMMARHKSFGITILGLALLRLAWRLIDRPPPPPPMPRWQQIAARLNHWGLYALLFALPLSGWLMSSAANRPASWFGLAQLPDFIAPDPGLKEVFEEVHEMLVNVLFVLAGLHVAAALKHQFVDRDGLLLRMLPGRAR